MGQGPAAVLPAAHDLDDPTAVPDDATGERAAAVDALRNPRRIDPVLLQHVLDGLWRL
ncbi:hypothetical protein [Saccharothrix xinjiangensis]|uniref:Uncharacterized protein n=1 Tax=Saccharothrix xinjiangensis TaxID=204798 RepID=A0ABV9XW44_9PSEU